MSQGKCFAPEQRRECTFVHDQSGEVSKTPHYHRRMQCEARSCFAYEQLRECTTVHDRSSAVARHEIDHNAPPPEIFLHNKCLPLPARVGNRAFFADDADDGASIR